MLTVYLMLIVSIIVIISNPNIIDIDIRKFTYICEKFSNAQ